MKKILLSLFATTFFVTAFSQDEYKKQPSLGIHFVLNDFKTATDLRTVGLSNVIKTSQYSKTSGMIAGMAVSYIQGLSNSVDFAGTLTGSYLAYPVPNKISGGKSQLLLEAVATGNVKLLSDKYRVSTFLTLGVGASKYGGYYSAFIPAGVGIQAKLFEGTFAVLNSQYRIPITENSAYHLYHSFGIVAPISKKK